MRFHQERFHDAARLFEKVCTLNHDAEKRELQLAYLGRCYLALGRDNDALDKFSAAYLQYHDKSKTLRKDFERQEFLQFLHACSATLQKVGQLERAREIAREAQEYSK